MTSASQALPDGGIDARRLRESAGDPDLLAGMLRRFATDTDALLREVGYSEAEIAALREEGVAA